MGVQLRISMCAITRARFEEGGDHSWGLGMHSPGRGVVEGLGVACLGVAMTSQPTV